MRRILLFFATLFAFVGAAFADVVSFEVNVPRVVAVGEYFRVEFTLNAGANQRDFEGPAFEGFDVLAGPSISSSSSIQIINGQTTRTESHTFSYVVLCPSEGDYTIGEATVRSKGKTYTTKAVTVKAIVENRNIWTVDFTEVAPFVEKAAGYVKLIQKEGMAAALKTML